MRNIFCLLIVLSSPFYLEAQNITDKQILKHIKGKEIEWISGENNLAKVKMKSTKKWGIYNINAYYDLDEAVIDFDEVVAPKFDSIGWFKNMEPFTIVKIKKNTVFL
ncbi:hypothetical protein [Corallibacter sp.]|uniref:hypothetical protein n=1 Tax=Corallibacter sp. TaxID=2038084 RepID=UPI003AB136FF